MRILFAGTPDAAVPSLRALSRAGHEIVGVITREDAPIGRKRTLTPSPVAQAAQGLRLEVRKANRLDSGVTAWATGLEPDLGVVVAYGGLIRDPLLTMPRLGWINLHFSDLPRWRGAAPVQRALAAGEQRIGLSVFRLVPELDAGAVLSRGHQDFAPGTTAGAALAELAESGTPVLLSAISSLTADPHAGIPQTGEASYAHKLERADGRLDLQRSAPEVLAHWAGMTPEPGAFALVGDQPVKILEARPFTEALAASGEPAGSASILSARAILRLGDGAIELLRVQPAGKPAMDAAAWLRGKGGSVVLS